jgi:hypothetical protein
MLSKINLQKLEPLLSLAHSTQQKLAYYESQNLKELFFKVEKKNLRLEWV